MSRTLGQKLIIENIAGAGDTTGSVRAMRANADGYSILKVIKFCRHQAGLNTEVPFIALMDNSDFPSGSSASLSRCQRHVRFAPQSRHENAASGLPATAGIEGS